VKGTKALHIHHQPEEDREVPKVGEHGSREAWKRLGELYEEGLESGLFDNALVEIATREMSRGEVSWRRVGEELETLFPGLDTSRMKARFDALRAIDNGNRARKGWTRDEDDEVDVLRETRAPDFVGLGERLHRPPVALAARFWDRVAADPHAWSRDELLLLKAAVGVCGSKRVSWSQVADSFAGRRSGEACRAAWRSKVKGKRDEEIVGREDVRRPRPSAGAERRVWSREEDIRLRLVVVQRGDDWRQSLDDYRRAEEFAGRSLSACRHRLAALKFEESAEFTASSNAQILKHVIAAPEGENGVNWLSLAGEVDQSPIAVLAHWARDLRQGGVAIWTDEIVDYVARTDEVAVPWWAEFVSTDDEEVQNAFKQEPSLDGWPADDDALRLQVAELGPAWTQIAKRFGCRPIDVAGRWHRIVKRAADGPMPDAADSE
jgi:hypothetical protein